MDPLVHTSPPRGQAGFSMLELMVSLSLVSIGVLTMAIAQLQALGEGNQARHRTHAAAIARDQMERIQGMAFSDPALTPMASTAFTTPPWLDNASEAALAPGEIPLRVRRPGGRVDETIYTVFYRVGDDDDTPPNPALRLVDLEVVWNEPRISNLKPTRTGQPTVAISSLLVDNDR